MSTKPIQMRLEAALLARVDAMRGEQSRTEVVRAALNAYLPLVAMTVGSSGAIADAVATVLPGLPVTVAGGMDPAGPALDLCARCGGSRGMHQRGCTAR